uniref:phospholipase D n=1 Tax=Hyaloperonospora arabidopsidis (strain Emoy2) TaxID=559515 RepID=M4C333_HYAAE
MRPRATSILIVGCVQLVLASSASASWSFLNFFGDKKNDDRSGGNGSSPTDLVTNVLQDEVEFEQPLLVAADWFLTEEEITASRGGVPRLNMVTYSTGNNVKTFTVTKEFFDSLYNDLSSTKANDRVMVTSYNTALIPFKPETDPEGITSRFDAVFGGVVKRGGDVKIICWATKFPSKQDINVRDKINELPTSGINNGSAQFIFDDRLPYSLSSHHQKTVIIAASAPSGADKYPVAYVGGIDITNDRWDTIYHNESALREKAGINLDYKGWVDSSLRIHGPAAKDVAANFLDRWNSPYLPTQDLVDNLESFQNPQYSFQPALNYSSSNTTSTLGHQSVQIVRTFSCKYKHYEFAPFGEKSLLYARIKAIKNAKNFIYVEDQYFIHVPELLDALMVVLPIIQRLVVVIQPPELMTKSGGYEKYMYKLVQPIKDKFPDKIRMYSMKPELNVYVHSKIVIIDDVYLSDGSANWNRRSMTSDVELNANIVDLKTVDSPDGVTVGKLVRDFRVRKFHEMTGRSYKEINKMKFLDSADLFDAAAAEKGSLIKKFDIGKKLYYNVIGKGLHQGIDPYDHCN